jgi:ABC-type Fe3+/spermidine/putrescine transport system ATPase subunit
MSFIEITQVSKHYGAFQALFDVSLSIRKGAFVTLLGPSGSGKTTLLKVLAGFEPVSQGRILLDGPRHHPGAAREAQLRAGVPGLCAVSAHDGA